MTCTDKTNMWVNDTIADPWGGEVKLIDVAADLQSIMVNVKTPWGSTDSSVEIQKGSSKTYTSGDKTYSVQMTLAGYVNDNYIGQIIICYEFVEKINTTTSMIFDEEASELIEGGMLYFNVLLKDENNNVLQHDVDIYINNVYQGNVYGDALYTHTITTDDIGQTLVFQAKFEGTEGLNASQSNTISIEIPGKTDTNLSIEADKTTVFIGETISFTGTLKDDNNDTVPNQTLYLVYKGINDQYVYVLNNDGYKLIASTDSNGNYYRPWEPTEDYLDYDTYAMYFGGDTSYNSTYSPNITINVVVDKCTQNIKIQDQDYNPVADVNVEMDNITKITDSDGLVSFTDIIRNAEYTVNKSYGEYTGENIIIGCKLDPQILHIIVPEEPLCIDYLTQTECEANGCYWWTSNNTCQNAPDGTTEYFDVYIKPYPFYEGKYEEAISKALEKVVDLTGAIANYISSVTGYEFKGIDILEETTKQVIVVRVYLKDTGETTLVAPIVIGAIVGIIAGILLLSIGYITGTSENDFTAEEVIELIDSASDKAIEECKERYPDRTISVDEAANFKHCVGGIETVRIIGSGDVVEEDSSEHIDYVINPVIVELDEKLDDGTLLPEDIDDAINDNLTIPTKEVVDDYKEKAIDDECAWMIGNTCVITKKALTTLAIGAVGVGALVALSSVKGIAKK